MATSTITQTNILLKNTPPEKKSEEFYEFEKKAKLAFSHIEGAETHLLRRQLILKKHPEVQQLMHPTSLISFYCTIGLVIAQLTLAVLLTNTSWPVFLLITYVVGGTIAHASHVLVHDFTHFVGDYPPTVSKVFGILCNVCIGIPSAISFGKYHADHHNFLNEYLKDPDLPLDSEAKLITGSKIKKFIFLLLVQAVYAIRPVLFYNRPTIMWEYINYVTILIVNFLVYKYLGSSALCYLLICGYLSIGPHPTAFHIFAEHFQFVTKMETYDYLGPLNLVSFNIGYHIEHHDFPSIPWYNLPKLRAMAPEFYQQFPVHTSYLVMMYKFLMDDNFGLFHRTIRTPLKN